MVDWISLGADDAGHAGQLAAAAREVVGVREARTDGATVRVRVRHAPGMLPLLLYGLDAAGLRPRSVDARRPTLDELFVALTGHHVRDGAADDQ